MSYCPKYDQQRKECNEIRICVTFNKQMCDFTKAFTEMNETLYNLRDFK